MTHASEQLTIDSAGERDQRHLGCPFGILIPLAAPLMASGSLPLLGFSIAMCISASAVDSSPLSTGGALVVANAEEQDQQHVFNRLMQWGLSMVVAAPLLSWLAFVVV